MIEIRLRKACMTCEHIDLRTQVENRYDYHGKKENFVTITCGHEPVCKDCGSSQELTRLEVNP